MIFFRENISSKLLDKYIFPYDITGRLFVELSFRNVNDYLLEHTIHHPKSDKIFSK